MNVSVMWFRRDLRLQDNEAVANAHAYSDNVLFVFVIDPWFFEQKELGMMRVTFLFESIAALNNELEKNGNRLVVLKGNSVDSITQLLQNLKGKGFSPTLFFNDDIQVSYGRERDESVTAFCNRNDIPLTRSLNSFLLYDESKMDEWWRLYYDYQHGSILEKPLIKPFDKQLSVALSHFDQLNPSSLADDLGLAPQHAEQTFFAGGEQQAQMATYTFLKDRVDGYRWKISRPYLAQMGATSLLGPHLAFGTISNRTVFQAAINYRSKLKDRKPKKAFDIATYLDRLRWRDSFTQRLWFHPELIWQNRFPEFDEIYQDGALNARQQEYFDRWKAGETGFPLLDAAMKQLAQDGFINFRMRAMAATFLTINCRVSWHHGARHFMNCLVDGDIAINHWQWQMQAGITNPLSPTFRMYSPTKNFRDRDSAAEYVHFWLPQTHGKNVETILQQSSPMLDFNETRKTNGKIISDMRKKVRERIIREKGIELEHANTSHRIVTNYQKFSADRYKRYIK